MKKMDFGVGLLWLRFHCLLDFLHEPGETSRMKYFICLCRWIGARRHVLLPFFFRSPPLLFVSRRPSISRAWILIANAKMSRGNINYSQHRIAKEIPVLRFTPFTSIRPIIVQRVVVCRSGRERAQRRPKHFRNIFFYDFIRILFTLKRKTFEYPYLLASMLWERERDDAHGEHSHNYVFIVANFPPNRIKIATIGGHAFACVDAYVPVSPWRPIYCRHIFRTKAYCHSP